MGESSGEPKTGEETEEGSRVPEPNVTRTELKHHNVETNNEDVRSTKRRSARSNFKKTTAAKQVKSQTAPTRLRQPTEVNG